MGIKKSKWFPYLIGDFGFFPKYFLLSSAFMLWCHCGAPVVSLLWMNFSWTDTTNPQGFSDALHSHRNEALMIPVGIELGNSMFREYWWSQGLRWVPRLWSSSLVLLHFRPSVPWARSRGTLGTLGGRFYWNCCLSRCFHPKPTIPTTALLTEKGKKVKLKRRSFSVLVMSPGKEALPVPRHSLSIFSFLLLISHLSLSTSKLPEQCHNTNNCGEPPTAKWCQWQGNNTVRLSHGMCWELLWSWQLAGASSSSPASFLAPILLSPSHPCYF